MFGELGIRCSLSVHLYQWEGHLGCCQIPASLGLSLIKCTLKKSIMVPINDLVEPLKALQLSV
jgi:hypothetical protein